VSPVARRRIGQAVIIVPTLSVSYGLGRLHFPMIQRLAISLGVAMIAIVLVGLWERGNRD
jgi:hypothetical protein